MLLGQNHAGVSQMILFKEIVFHPIPWGNLNVFVIRPTSTTLFMADELERVCSTAGVGHGPCLLIYHAIQVKNPNGMVSRRVYCNFGELFPASVIDKENIPLALKMNCIWEI